MSKIKAVWELFDKASREVSKNGKEWADYLKFASRIYKYNFDNALQIYGQNKDATMLAEREIWENRIGRTINKEHTNIAVFDVMSAKPQLRYLIDISDTSGDEKTYPRLWRLTPENSQPLLERLKRQHPADVNTVYEYIDSEVLRRVREIRPGFYDGIKRNTEGSPLFRINDGELESKVNVMVWNSAAYMMYSRCGFDTSIFDGVLEDISDFNNKSLLYRIGNCATIIARDFLSECATNLNQLAKERREQAIREKNNTEPQIAPPVSAKRRISENIRKGAGKTAEANPTQLSIFDNDEEVAETVDVSSVSVEIDDDKVIRSIASYGSLFAGGKRRIYEFFQSNTDWKDRANFLKNEYGICSASINVNDVYVSWSANGKGIEYRATENSDDKKRITWNSFAKYVQEAINEGTYYIPEPKAEIQENETADETENIKPDFKYGDFISLNGNIFEVLDSDEKEQTTDLGDIQFYVSPHKYVLVEATPWVDLKTAKIVKTPEKALPEIHVNDYVEYQSRKYKITRIDGDRVHLLDETYKGNLHPQLWTNKSTFIEAPIYDIREALRNTDIERTYTKEDFFNCEIEMLSKEYDGKTFYFPYAIVYSDRFLLNFAPKEEWTEQELANGRKNAYKDYLMDYLGYSHKEALTEAEIMTEDEYDRYYSNNYKVNIEDQFSVADRQYEVLNFDQNKQEVLVRDITNSDEENLPLYEIFDIPFVYHRTQAIKNLRNVELQDFLNAPVDFINVTFGEGDEETVYTYGYLYLKDAVIYMDYTVDNPEWTEKEVESGQRRAFRNYLSDVMGYSDKEACAESGLMQAEEYDKLTETFVPVSDIPKVDEVLNTPVEETETQPLPTANENSELSVAELFEKIHSEDNGKTIALFPVGDFYEAYGDDAKNLVEELELHLTNKVVDGRKYDMCGFPNHILEQYVNTLNDKGYDVALVDENNKVFRSISTEKALGNAVDTKETVATVIESRIDYTYSPDDNIDAGGPKAKFKANIEAIKLLNQIESENRLAMADEQRILCKYVGWGGLSEAFDENNSSWSSEYAELKGLLTDDEYKSALASVLCAHYTPPEIIENIYATLERMGFKGGNVLDPAMGTGLFFAAMPEEMKKNSKLYGYEIDDISGRIAKQLTQTANIKIQGYETNEEPDNFFDIAVGNIPFGDYKLFDPKFNKYKFLIHDYFIAKTLEKVRPGGIIAFISSKGTLDKENDSLRKYVGNRAELLGAIRMPNNTFRKMANTEVTADIIFLQKRERIVSAEPYWTKLDVNSEGIPVNAYFEQNPFMLLGSMQYDNRFGTNSITYLKAADDFDLKRDLPTALSAIEGHITEYERTEEADSGETIPADPNVRNFTYAFVDNSLYYRENSIMRKMEYEGRALERIKNLCEIRDITRGLIEAQTDEEPDDVINTFQTELNKRYDLFVKKYGNISISANERVFRDDSDYPLLCSLEKYDDETKTYSKTDIFSKRTIKPEKKPESVDNALDALKLSLSEYGRVNLDYMCRLYHKSQSVIFDELKGQIYLNPEKINGGLPPNLTIEGYFSTYGDKHKCIETADEYLSGDVRQKLKMASFSADGHPELFSDNVSALEEVQPPLLTAAEIAVSTGLTWIDKEDYTQFMYEKFNTPSYAQHGSNAVTVEYNRFTNAFAVRNKSYDGSSVTVTQTYGTNRMNAYEIFEASLNMRSATVRDVVEKDGKTTYPVNQKESMLAREKQYLIEEAFRSWIFEEPERRKKYVDYYNENFNNIRLRKYDGSFLTFPGMTNDIIMREHQKNAVARALFSNTNELLDHKVGAGKSFVMVASCMELKRLGLANKSIFVVPNHLTGQMGAEFLRLYPFANILVTTKKDFEKKNRLRFVSKIATGDWDAVIIGHSQFEKISMSKERQIMMLEKQVNEIIEAVAIAKAESGDRITIKQMEKMKTNLNTQIQELSDDSKKDDLITFESLGIDYMFVDEAHYFKNCAVFSKMRNVAGIAQTKAKKATDMLMKCRYMQEINEGKGVVFATGTPISNSMTEMFVMQRYLDPNELEKRHLMHFDAWAAQYGECVTSLELAPEGTGYRYRTRFAKFKNMPELLTMYHNFADVVTDEDLNLPIPKMRGGKPIVVNSEPSDFVVMQMMEFVERANAIHNGMVSSSDDNMLKITNEARLLATDPRLIDPLAEHTSDSKVSMCAENVYREYEKSADIKGTQIVFCDIGTPKAEGIYNVYDGLKADLIIKGISEDEICFIHDAKTDAQREELFALMRSGEKRVIIGSTSKLGVGTNIQNRIVALHNLDCPYRPSDIEQRLGRGLRQGNMNDEVAVYTYVTQNTFDAYMWQIVENKQRFISQIKSGRMVDRTCEDIDETVLTFAEVKAIATGDERIKEKMDLDLQVNRLKMLKSNYDNQRYSLQDQFTTKYPRAIAEHEKMLEKIMADKEVFEQNKSENFCVTVNGQVIDEREKAGEIFITMAKSLQVDEKKNIGSFCGFNLEVEKLKEFCDVSYYLRLVGNLTYKAEMSSSAQGNTIRLEHLFETMNKKITETQGKLETDRKNLENAKIEYEKPFAYEDELKEKSERLMFLNSELDLDKKDDVVEENDENSEEDEPVQTNEINKQSSNAEQVSALDDMPYSALEKQNYRLIRAMFPEMLNGKCSYMKFRQESYDDMYIENIGGNTLALCLFHLQNGDVMRDPEYTFKFDNEKQAVRILEWQLDSLGKYECVYDADNPKLYSPGLKKDLDEAFNSTLNDIMKIGYEEYTRHETDEECDEAEI